MSRQPSVTETVLECRDCHRSKVLWYTGRCWGCYQRHQKRKGRDKGKAADPKRVEMGKRFGGVRREPTAKELDAIIAEQSKNLPTWWDRESKKAEGG